MYELLFNLNWFFLQYRKQVKSYGISDDFEKQPNALPCGLDNLINFFNRQKARFEIYVLNVIACIEFEFKAQFKFVLYSIFSGALWFEKCICRISVIRCDPILFHCTK